jgi:hypothetical protein
MNNILSLMMPEWCGSGGQHASHVQKTPTFSPFSLPKKHHRTFSPFSPQKKNHRTMEEVTTRFIGRTVTQVSGHMLEGSPLTQQAAYSVLDDLAMPDNNVFKVIVTSKTVNGTPTQGISQDTCRLLIHSKKIKIKKSR